MAQLKSTSVTGNLSVTGNVVASQIIKLDGGINDILFADGSTYNYKNTNADWYYNSGAGYSSWNIGKVSRNGIFTLHKNGGFINIQADGTPGAGTPFIIPAFEGRAAVFDKAGLQNASSETEKIIIAIDDNNKKDILRYRTVNQFRADLKLAQVYDYKGTISDINALKAISSANIGDTYFISSIGESWSCRTKVTSATGDNYQTYWSSIGSTVDLSGYVTLNTDQTVTGAKTFSNMQQITMNGNGPITFPQTPVSGDNQYSPNHYISAGSGYSTNSGQNGMKLICCDQSDAATGMGQDLGKGTTVTGTPSWNYDTWLVGGKNGALATSGYISFGFHTSHNKDYDRVSYIDAHGNFYTRSSLNAQQLNLYRVKGASYGRISFYNGADNNYTTWFEYMSDRTAGSCTTGGTPSEYGEVTNWARRSIVENNNGYGWIWESISGPTATGNPDAVMSLHANNGNLALKGSLTLASSATFQYNTVDKCIDVIFN